MKNKPCIECGRSDQPWYSKKRCRNCAIKSYAKKVAEKNKQKYAVKKSDKSKEALSKVFHGTKRISEKGLEMMKKDRAFYKLIWESRPHICEECGQYLGENLNIGFISHILSKGSSPEHRHDSRNAQVLCLPCHTWWETGKREKMKTYGSNQEVMLMLKQEYSQKKL